MFRLPSFNKLQILKFNHLFLFLVTVVFVFSFAFSNVNASYNKIDKKTLQIKESYQNLLFLVSVLDGNNEETILSDKEIATSLLNLSLKNPTKKPSIVKSNKNKTVGTHELNKIFNKKIHQQKNHSKQFRKKAKTIITKKLSKKRAIQKRLAYSIPSKRKSHTKIKKAWSPKSKRLRNIYKKVLRQKRIDKIAVQQAFKFYERNKRAKRLSNKYITIADYTKISSKKRLHLVDLRNAQISSYYVSHAKKSGLLGGRVISTSNKRGSHKTSKGFFKVGYREGITATKKYDYLTVRGLEKANRKVGWPTRLGGRDVIIHTAKYADSGGRSDGCFVIRPRDRKAIFKRIKGSLFYSYTG